MIGEDVREEIHALLEDQFEDYNTLQFQEILAEEHGIQLNSSTL